MPMTSRRISPLPIRWERDQRSWLEIQRDIPYRMTVAETHTAVLLALCWTIDAFAQVYVLLVPFNRRVNLRKDIQDAFS